MNLLFVVFRWMGVVSLAVIYNAIMIIVRATYHQFNDVLLPLWLVLDYGADVIYIMDMGVQGTTSKFESRTSNITSTREKSVS